MTPKDTRKRVRIDFNDDAVVTTKSKTFEQMKCKNISLNGAYIYCDTNLFKLNDFVEILFSIFLGDTSISLEIKGKIVRFGDDGIGINFQEMSPETFAHLANYIELHVIDKERFKKEMEKCPKFEP